MKPKTIYFLKTVSIVFMLTVSLWLNAQTPTDTSNTIKIKDLSEVVVTGQYGENSLTKSVYKVKIIDSKRIQAQGAVNLKDVLSNELNIRVNQDPILGSSSISLQGVSGQSIKILIDGVPVIGREGGNIDLSQINMNNVERIEIIEGPMSVNFGTDALGGVLNIITKKTKQNEYKANLNTYYESIGTYNADIALSAANGKWNTQVNGGRNFFSGYSNNENSRVMLWKPREQYFADINIGKALKYGNIKWKNNFFNEKISNKGEANYNLPEGKVDGQDAYYYTRRITSSLFFDKKINQNGQLNIVAAYNNYRRMLLTYKKNLQTLQQILIPENDLQDTNYFNQYMSRGTYSYTNKKSILNYQLGYDINYETAEGGNISSTYKAMGDYSLFGSGEFKIAKKIIVRPGFRATYNTLYNAPLTPSINIKYDVSEKCFLRLSYARGFRTPSLKELYLNLADASHNIHGNTNLKAETSNNIQGTVTYQIKTEQKLIRFESTVFYNYISDMIDLARVNTLSTEMKYVNINQFESTGLNTNIEYKYKQLNLAIGYAYTGRKNNLFGNTNTNEFFFYNDARANASFTFKNNLCVSVFYKFNGKFQAYQYNFINNKVMLSYFDAYSLCDATVSKSMIKKQLNITAGIKNIMNVVNVNANYIGGYHATQNNTALAGVGRTFFISLHYLINKQN